MNISGKSVALAYKHHLRPAPLHRIIVVHDSLAHKPFATSSKLGGSANGHNGVRDAVAALGSADFARIRVGIGAHAGDAAHYVLERMSSKELSFWGGSDGAAKVWADIGALVARAEAGTG